jgi:hypothetical protein
MMVEKTQKKTKKGKTIKKATRKTKSVEDFECFYCSGVVKEWNWRCPHCGKLFSSGKKAIAVFVVLIVICAIIGTYGIWYREPRTPWPLTIDEVHPAPGNTTASLGAHPDVWFDLDHILRIPLDKEACARAYSITPELNGTVSWGGWGGTQILALQPNDLIHFDGWLQPNTTYYVNVTTECRDVQGNHLDREWNSWFTTRKIPGQ